MKKALSLVLVLIMALSLAACGGVSETETTSEISTQPETLVVPNVVGMDKDEAVKLLEGMGFEVEVKRVNIFFISEKDTAINSVVEQNLNPETVCTKDAKIVLSYASDEPEFEYRVNDDKTITLTILSAWTSKNKTLTIPKEYNSYRVESVVDNVINAVPDDWTVKIPEGVTIIGTANRNVVNY